MARSELSTRHASSRSMYTTACTSRSFMASLTLDMPRCDTASPSSKPGVSRKAMVNPAAFRAARRGRSVSGWNGAAAATRSLRTELSVELLPTPCLPTNTTVISVWPLEVILESTSLREAWVLLGWSFRPAQSLGPAGCAWACACCIMAWSWAAAGVMAWGTAAPSSSSSSSSSSSYSSSSSVTSSYSCDAVGGGSGASVGI